MRAAALAMERGSAAATGFAASSTAQAAAPLSMSALALAAMAVPATAPALLSAPKFARVVRSSKASCVNCRCVGHAPWACVVHVHSASALHVVERGTC